MTHTKTAPACKLTSTELATIASWDVGHIPDPDAYAAFCKTVKRDHGGRYPDDWYEVVVASGKLYLLQAWWER